MQALPRNQWIVPSAFSTSLECEQRWYLLKSEDKEEIAAHQLTSPQTGSIVDAAVMSGTQQFLAALG
ncbi:hypothetical protein ATANTOWER_031712 [Ataeniobius toweri]|uniref:Uncharacterized protein n=1 Tax=Ataeniobius toweri TaxID=208326 RepID=A0ABU7BD16_9TELE|nr:hypothetical protein [Ataeniobius toweri]